MEIPCLHCRIIGAHHPLHQLNRFHNPPILSQYYANLIKQIHFISKWHSPVSLPAFLHILQMIGHLKQLPCIFKSFLRADFARPKRFHIF